MAVVVLDASVVIALLQVDDRKHEAAVDAFERSADADLVLPASAYAEILVIPMRRGAAAVTTTEGFLTERDIGVHPVTRDLARRAAELRAGHPGLRLPDALVIATGDVLDALVLTADRGWSKISKRVRVI